MFGGAAPERVGDVDRDAGPLREADGNTTVAGLDNTATWPGVNQTSRIVAATPMWSHLLGVAGGVALLRPGHRRHRHRGRVPS